MQVSLQVLRRSAHASMRWRNGTGVTHEVACSPSGSTVEDFDWRISFAEIGASGAFSAFHGVDRTILLVDGARVSLILGGTDVHPLRRFEPFAFPGEEEVTCMTDGPSWDLNVMTRRGRSVASVSCLRIDREPVTITADPDLTVFLAVLDGHPTATDTSGPVHLGTLDVVNRPTEPVTVQGACVLAKIMIRTGDRG